MNPKTETSTKDLSLAGVLVPGDVVSLDLKETFNLPRGDWRGMTLPALKGAVAWKDEKQVALLCPDMGSRNAGLIVSRKRCNRALISVIPSHSAVKEESGKFSQGDFIKGPAFEGEPDTRGRVVAAINGMIYAVDEYGREFMGEAAKFKKARARKSDPSNE